MTAQKYVDYRSLESLPELEKYRCLNIVYDSDQFRKLQTEQILSQMGLTQTRNNPFECNDFKDIAKQAIIRANQPLRKEESVRQIFARALTISDFQNLLIDLSTKLIANGWTTAPVSYPDWTRTVEVPNFKENTICSISSFSKFSKTGDHGEIEMDGNFLVEGSNSFKLETFARIFPINRRAYINDDLDVIKTAPMLMGASARQMVEETVFSLLLSNPVLSDGIAMFHEDHNNLISRCSKCH